MATEYIADDSGFDGTVWDGQSVHLTASAFAARGVGVANRSGVLPAVGSPLAYVSNGDMTGTLKAGAYWIASPTAVRGGFLVVVPTDQVFTHPTAASSVRTDFVIVEVAATGVAASSFKKIRLHTVASGGGTPVMPGPIGVGASILLHAVPVGANATAIGQPQDLRTYTAAAGGMVQVNSIGELAALPAGTPYYDLSTARAGIVKPGGHAPFLTNDTPWPGAFTKVIGASPTFSTTAYTTLTTTYASFSVNGGQTFIRATIDVQLTGAASLSARFAGDPQSEDVVFLEGGVRQTMRLSSMRYAPLGTLGLVLEVKVFNGTAKVNGGNYAIYSTGLVGA